MYMYISSIKLWWVASTVTSLSAFVCGVWVSPLFSMRMSGCGFDCQWMSPCVGPMIDSCPVSAAAPHDPKTYAGLANGRMDENADLCFFKLVEVVHNLP